MVSYNKLGRNINSIEENTRVSLSFVLTDSDNSTIEA